MLTNSTFTVNMKQLLTCLCLISAFSLQAQLSFSDDFESYTAGAGVALASSTWATWTGNVAGEDAPVSTDRAHSGTQSLKFLTSSANGGPSDVIMPFGGPHTTGDFTMEFWMYVESGKGAYFNLQAENTPGQKWTADFFFDKNGTMDAAVDGATIPVIIDAAYPNAQWFHFKLQTDLSSNTWSVLVDNVEVGKFFNPSNKIATLDLFSYGPSGSLGHFYIDDFAFTFDPLVQKPNDAAMYQLSSRTIGLTGDQLPVTATLRNLGTNAITSFDVSMDNGQGPQTSSVTGVNIAPLSLYTFDLPSSYTLVDGEQDLNISFSNINGGLDDDPANNDKTAVLRGYTPAPNRGVVVEEATGTWCQWCVRGIVFMERLRSWYPNHFIGIGVHNNDPMEIAEYDAGLTSLPDFSGFPSVAVERKLLINPASMELPVLEALTQPTPAALVNGASFDANTGELKVSVTANFTQAVTGDYRIIAVLVEDEVTGTGSGYAQSNAYAGGANGPMGGFENKPATIPAAQMVYEDVARALLGGFAGQSGSLPGAIAAGASYSANYTYTLTPENDITHMRIVGILIDENGAIVNGNMETIDEAIANGFTVGADDVRYADRLDIAPNPAADAFFLRLSVNRAADAQVRVFNSLGAVVRDQNLGTVAGEYMTQINTADLSAGVYNVQVTVGTQVIAKKVVVKR